MIVSFAMLLVGIAVLLVAGDLLVRGAVGLASAMRVPALLVSLTIVAFGTSAPELVVSVQAVLTDNAGIALGNIIGSNIANILLVLGLPAIIYPISTHVTGLRRHGVVMLLATAAFMAIAYFHGAVDFPTGVALFAGIVAYVAYMGVRAMQSKDNDPVIDDIEGYNEGSGFSAKTAMFLIAGLIGLPIGAHLLVTHGAGLARVFDVREEVIGLTVVAFGTSLPELATVAAAAVRKKSDVAIGGVVGSNIFNILAVGGAAGMAGRAAFDPATLRFDLPIMAGVTLLLAGLMFARRDIGRTFGIVLTLAYVAFIAALAFKAA